MTSATEAIRRVRQPVVSQPYVEGVSGCAEGYVERCRLPFLFWLLAVATTMRLPVHRWSRRLRNARYSGPPPACKIGAPDVVIRGIVLPPEARTYLVLPFEVSAGTGRLEIEYDFAPLAPALPKTAVTQTVVDLGLWDEHGYRNAEGFRGWSGSRHREVFLEPGDATRCYKPGSIRPGVWFVELGFAAIGPTGAAWTVTIRARPGETSEPRAPLPVDPNRVANPKPGWYHGDFHMHSWHSNPHGPAPERFVEIARQAGLDFTPVTEYVVDLHWDEYGEVQRRHPDLLIWPGREIITYFGHMQCIGETRGFVEYRHGFEDVRAADIQKAVVAAGALFQINHPTSFKGRLFRNLCRGCAFELTEEIDWGAVDTIEVLTGPAMIRRRLPLRNAWVEIENPFMASAIEYWERLLNAGYRVTAVCGSDVKQGKGLGSCATAVWADELSRDALTRAIRAGSAYVRTRGVVASPALEMAGFTADGQSGGFGSRLVVRRGEEVRATVTVAGGIGEALRIICNGNAVATVSIDSDVFTHEFPATRKDPEGPLGTWWRIETFDHCSRTTIGNPLFLGEAAPAPPSPPPPVRVSRPLRRNLSALRSRRSLPHRLD